MFKYFLSKPNVTGAICASSPELARMITRNIGLETACAVAEIGPGTGAFTGRILSLIPQTCSFFTVEINPQIAGVFRERFPAVKLYEESAANLRAIAAKEGVPALNAVVSGLPWACFPESLQDELLTAITQTLAPDGVFVTFSYLKPPFPKDRQFRRKLSSYFGKIERSPIVWRNMPPAFVFRCSK